MINFLDYLSSLTAANSRAGQNRLVSASVQTLGYESVAEGLSGNSSSYQAADILGIIQDTATVSVQSSTGKIVKVAYTKVLLKDPYNTPSDEVISYLWFPTKQIQFVETSDKSVAPVATDKTVLSPVYSEAPNGITLRASASTLSKKIQVVALGDIVGYTNGIEQKYAAYIFWEIFDQKGKFIGWCAKGKGLSSLSKPASSSLPKYDTNGETTQDSPPVSYQQDPQVDAGTTQLNIGKILAWGLGIPLAIWVVIKIVSKLFKKKIIHEK